MTTTDTRAALDAAVDALIVRRADAIAGANDDLPAERAARKAIDRAITAHVAAEVARALAAAPGVEEAIALVCHDHSGGGRECDCKIATVYDKLRAAIAADRARAVAEARPTPDEARRLVDAYDSAIRVAERAVTSGAINGDHTTRQVTARAALLRALGVES